MMQNARRGGVLFAVLLLGGASGAGCIGSRTSACEDLRCPGSEECDPIHVLCIQAVQRHLCAGRPDGELCEVDGVAGFHCDQSVCIPGECGDGVNDAHEECDAGEANSDTAPDTCRRGCVDAFCGDGVCDPGRGEDPASCLGDCPSVCGDGLCTAGEAPELCLADCPVTCGDSICSLGEDPINCNLDCPSDCGDGYCSLGEDPINCNGDCPTLCGDGYCSVGEDLVNCNGDCLAQTCDLQTITPAGAPTDFIVTAVHLPVSVAEADQIGVDLNGDGRIDNQWGKITASLATLQDPNAGWDTLLANGSVVVLGRQYVDGFPDDATVLSQIFQGQALASPPQFDGSDVASVATGSATQIFACGALASGELTSEHGRLWLPVFGAPNQPPVWIQPIVAYISGSTSASGWVDMKVGGGLSQDQVYEELLPAVVLAWQVELAANPGGTLEMTLLPIFDGNCIDTARDCGHIINGVGDCTQDGTITQAEVRCNSIISSLLQPDVDLDGDGVRDVLSFGMRLQAVRATIQ